MCGRYRRSSDKKRIAEVFHVEAGLDEVEFSPSDNITPGSFQPVVYMSERGEVTIGSMLWGFKFERPTFNARSDKLATNSFWKSTLKARRCIVPADSIFEWRHVYKDKKKNPKYEITIPGQEPFGMAAIWHPWKQAGTGEVVPTVAVITTDPNEEWAEFHDRQTAILEPQEYKEWLTPNERPPLHLLRVFPEEEMQIRLVGGLDPDLQLSLAGL
jgi:putative SOS response-associated peptidase YedK